MTVEPNTQAAIDFLEQWRPGGPWVLTAISTDRKAIRTGTFESGSSEQLGQWLDEYNGRLNVYFHVNPTTRALTKKAEREDIAELAWLHVDIDPAPTSVTDPEELAEHILAEQCRALNLLLNPPGTIPEPTVVIFSGGGYQGFWKLAEPFHIGGDLARAEEAKLWNLQLEVMFGADNCHNVDRIMRLPGTVNIPDGKKRRKGRTEALAELVQFREENVYTLDTFTAANAVQVPGQQPFAPAVQVEVSGNVPRLQDLDELDQWGVADRVKVILAQGRHPDEVKEDDDSRSAWLFDAVCQLVRANVPDETIYAIITDPDLQISESVLDKGSNAQKYALRQIAQAKEHAIDPRLAEFNQRFAVIGNMGGKCRVVEEQEDPVLHRSTLTKQSFADFRNRYMAQTVEVGEDRNGNPRFLPLGEWWLRHHARCYYDRIVFAPGKEYPNAYNLWKGFACDARPGDCGLFLDHLRLNLCSDVEEHYSYLLGWMARAVQRPAVPGQVAVVLRGRKGTGKSFFAKQLGGLFGRHYLQVSNPGHLVGNFNAHLRDCVLLFADEAFYAGDKKHESVLKTLITEELITIEAKGVDAETSPNCTHLVMASDGEWVVPAGADERRFFVLDVGDDHKQDSAYFGRIAKQMAEGGREALLHALLTYDLSDFQVRKVPQTKALAEQKLLSLQPDEEWWYRKLYEGILITNDEVPWPLDVKKERLLDDHIDYMRRLNIARRSSATALGRFLRRVCPGVTAWQGKAGSQRPYFYSVPCLADCRAAWDNVHGAQEWPTVQQMNLPDMGEPF